MSSSALSGLSGSESSSLDNTKPASLAPEEKNISNKSYCEAKPMEVFEAVKSGSVDSVRSLVEKEGVGVLSARDEKGHTPAHWACLGGHAAILRYIIENHAPVNESGSDSVGARPIHWAAVKGHIAPVAILCQAGVSIDTPDNKGCTPLIVACQYGQVTLAGYLMGKGARLQLTDNDGDNALHWAAFRGHSALLPLLMYSGFNVRQKDSHGQTPLHLACINGNMSTVKQLCKQEGVELDPLDDHGHTPLMLAMGRRHKEVVSYLRKAAQVRTHFLPKFNFWTVVFGPGNSKGPLLFFVVASFLWGYPMYICKGLPDTYEDLYWLNVAFIVCNILMWVALYHANSVDPGYLPRNIPEYDQAIRQVAYVDEWKVGTSPISRLCHTCRTIKGPRTKHCRYCNRCVTMFDHHCPYIYNCVGYHNRVSFYIFSVLVSVAGYIAMYLSYYVLDKDGYPMRPDYLFGIGCYIFFQGIATFVVLSTTYHAVRNITTNEGINWKRYSHLKDSEGRFHNPYDQGFVRNLLEFFLLVEPSTPEHLENVSVGSSDKES